MLLLRIWFIPHNYFFSYQIYHLRSSETKCRAQPQSPETSYIVCQLILPWSPLLLTFIFPHTHFSVNLLTLLLNISLSKPTQNLIRMKQSRKKTWDDMNPGRKKKARQEEGTGMRTRMTIFADVKVSISSIAKNQRALWGTIYRKTL